MDPFELASMLNINVVDWDLHNDIKGYYRYYKKNKFIMLNCNQTPNSRRFVCCHELGHAVLHPHANTPFMREKTFLSVDKIEVEANYFAVHLLLSHKNLQDYETKYDILRDNGIPVEMERFL
jgi:Zn-dependent peptidase ImmA (M78 family)